METDNITYNLPIENKLSEEILSKIKLDEHDTVSVLFLLNFRNPNALEDVLKALDVSAENGNFWKTYLINSFPQWKNLLFEILILIQNLEIFQLMKYTNSEINNFINYRCVPTQWVNELGKNLYLLCDALNKEKLNELLIQVHCMHIKQDFKYLELYLLYWIKIGFITIFDTENQTKGNLTNLLRILKIINMNKKIYVNLMELNVTTKTDNACQKNKNLIPMESPNFAITSTKNKNLCIIINEENYNNSTLDRTGSQLDFKNLCKTFKSCKFYLITYHNLNYLNFNRVIREIPLKYKHLYESIVLCILSHGQEGGILTCDEKFVSFKYIKTILCCSELEDVMKIVIAQCCQGNNLGVKRKKELLVDGIEDVSIKENIGKYKNYVLWKATIDKFTAIRDPEIGTWFVQELCSFLQHERDDRELFNCYTHVNEKLQMKEGEIKGVPVSQLSEMTNLTFTKKFIFPSFNEDKQCAFEEF